MEDAIVGSNELVTLKGGCDDDAVGGISVQSGQESRPGCYDAIDRYFNDAVPDHLFSPGIQILSKVKSAFLGPHPGFPEGYGGDCGVALAQCRFHLTQRVASQPTVACPQPDDNVGVNEYQKRS